MFDQYSFLFVIFFSLRQKRKTLFIYFTRKFDKSIKKKVSLFSIPEMVLHLLKLICHPHKSAPFHWGSLLGDMHSQRLRTHSGCVRHQLWLHDNKTSCRRVNCVKWACHPPLIYWGTHSVWPPIYTLHFASLEIKWNKPSAIAGMWSPLGVSGTAMFDLIHWGKADRTLQGRVPSWGSCLSTITISSFNNRVHHNLPTGSLMHFSDDDDDKNRTFPAKKLKSSAPRMWRSSVDSSFCRDKMQKKVFSTVEPCNLSGLSWICKWGLIPVGNAWNTSPRRRPSGMPEPAQLVWASTLNGHFIRHTRAIAH